MFKNNPEEFIAKVIKLIKEQKATMIVEHISYDQIEGGYDSTIFTAEKSSQTFDKAIRISIDLRLFVQAKQFRTMYSRTVPLKRASSGVL